MFYSDAMLPLSLLDSLYIAYYTRHIHSVKKEFANFHKTVNIFIISLSGSLTLAHSRNSQMSFMYGFFFVKFLFYTVVCVVIMI